MTIIRKHITVRSETIHIEELKKFQGKKVEIIVVEEPDNYTDQIDYRMKAFFAAAHTVNIDEAAIRQLRKVSLL